MDSNIIVKEVTLSLTISFQLGNIIVQFIELFVKINVLL